MNKNDQSKKIRMVILLFMGVMFFFPALMMNSFGGFSFFSISPFLVFLIFGWFFNFIAKKAKTNQQESSSTYKSYTTDRHCTSCHQAIGLNHEFCPYCGSEQSDHITCDYCGEKNSKEDLMCSNCNGLLK